MTSAVSAVEKRRRKPAAIEPDRAMRFITAIIPQRPTFADWHDPCSGDWRSITGRTHHERRCAEGDVARGERIAEEPLGPADRRRHRADQRRIRTPRRNRPA